jgi:seryl-tRNA synthetase
VDQWLEVSSVSWFSDYQARRANVRYRPAATDDEPGGPSGPSERKAKPRPQVVHTLNGSALAVPRVWAAVVETHRQPDGSVALPRVLHPYLRGQTVFGAS